MENACIIHFHGLFGFNIHLDLKGFPVRYDTDEINSKDKI